ncbi:MAG: solute carrier family 23 protein [Acidobacteriota bacterium]
MKLEFGLEDKPPLAVSLILGLQWAFIAISTIVILGKIVSSLHFAQSQETILYLQKLFFLTGAALIVQVVWGHRLPLISGPAAVLLIGVVSSGGAQISVINTAIILGGIFVSLLAAAGLFRFVRKIFTARVIAVVLLLIVFTLAPTILDLMTGRSGGINPGYNFTFSVLLVLSIFFLEKALSGIWKTGVLFFSILGGSFAYFLVFPSEWGSTGFKSVPWAMSFFSDLTIRPQIVPGVLLSFMICYLALVVNDLGSIQSLNEMLDPPDKDKRIHRGVLFTGAANVVSGFLGVLGPVNYSLSPGVIASTRCASRFPLILAGFLVLLLSPFPRLIGLMGSVPSVVIGGVMVYVMASQFAAGLSIAVKGEPEGEFSFQSGIIIGLPVLLGNLIAFLPSDILEEAPALLQPLLGNGFVAGIVCVLFLEHVIFSNR